MNVSTKFGYETTQTPCGTCFCIDLALRNAATVDFLPTC